MTFKNHLFKKHNVVWWSLNGHMNRLNCELRDGKLILCLKSQLNETEVNVQEATSVIGLVGRVSYCWKKRVSHDTLPPDEVDAPLNVGRNFYRLQFLKQQHKNLGMFYPVLLRWPQIGSFRALQSNFQTHSNFWCIIFEYQVYLNWHFYRPRNFFLAMSRYCQIKKAVVEEDLSTKKCSVSLRKGIIFSHFTLVRHRDCENEMRRSRKPNPPRHLCTAPFKTREHDISSVQHV